MPLYHGTRGATVPDEISPVDGVETLVVSFSVPVSGSWNNRASWTNSPGVKARGAWATTRSSTSRPGRPVPASPGSPLDRVPPSRPEPRARRTSEGGLGWTGGVGVGGGGGGGKLDARRRLMAGADPKGSAVGFSALLSMVMCRVYDTCPAFVAVQPPISMK